MEKELTIKIMKTSDEMRQIQALERMIWQMDPTPIHQTVTAVKHGGLMLAAFYKDELVGFSYGFAGFSKGKTYLCSHMLGIHPAYQSKGIGKYLKDEQLNIAREMGYELVIWTFDPLETRNAYLNTSKLFGICNTYIVDCYGQMNDGLNSGLPTDRFQIDWWVNSERVKGKWTPERIVYHQPFDVRESTKGNPMLHIKEDTLAFSSEGIEVPVPQHIQQIKVGDPELALDWRMKTRTIFKILFESGYALIGVRRSEDSVHYYQFIKKETIPFATN